MADRDAKVKWAQGMAGSSLLGGFGGIGGTIATGLGRTVMGKVFG